MARKIGNTVFYLAIVLETLFVLLDKSAYIIQHETWWFRFTFLLFSIKIACTKYSKKEWACLFSFIVLGTISWFFTDREEIIRIVALVAACKGMELKKLLKVVLYETLSGTAIIMLLSFLGVYGNLSVTGMFRGGGVEITRYCFGMGHPNAFHCMMMMLILLIFAVYEEKMRWYGYAAAVVVNIVFGYFTDSRTGALITMVMIVFAVLIHYCRNSLEHKAVYILSELLIVGCTLWSVFIAIVGVEHPLLFKIDHLFNGRFQWAKSDGGIQYWSLFSNEMNQNYFDMAYVKLFYWYGIIPAIVFLTVLMLAVWKCRELKAYDALLIFLTLAVYSLMEAHVVSTYIGRNYALFCVGTILPEIINQSKQGKLSEYSLIDIGKVSIKRWSRNFN